MLHSTNLNSSALRAKQFNKLKAYLKYQLYPYSPFYHKWFKQHDIQPANIRTIKDWEQLPLTSKQDLTNPRDFILQPNQENLVKTPSLIFTALTQGKAKVKKQLQKSYQPLMLTSTTGRSADPVPFFYTQNDLDALLDSGQAIMKFGGSKPNWKHLNLFPYSPHLAFWQTHYAGLALGSFMHSTGGGKIIDTETHINLINKIQPEVIIGMPTFIYHVLSESVESGNYTWKNIKTIVLGGEKSPTGLRHKLKDFCAKLGSPNVSILSTYGFTESKMAWAECRHAVEQERPGYHLLAEHNWIDIINPSTLEPVGLNQPGEIVYSSIGAHGSAVMRYRTGDCIDGGLTYEPCPYCHCITPRLVGSISRLSSICDMKLDKVKGTLIDLNQCENLLDEFSQLGAWQLVLKKINDDPMDLDELILYTSLAPHQKNNSEQVAQLIEQEFKERLEISLNAVHFETMEEIKKRQGVGIKLKETRLLDLRKS